MAEPAPSYATSRERLGESATLADAAPRMLAAVCECAGLGVRRALGGGSTRAERCTASAPGTTRRSSSPIRRQQPRRRRSTRGRRPARAGLGVRPSRPGSRTSSPTPIFRARRRPIASACTARSRCRSFSGGDVLGVMEFFSRDIRQPDAALLDTMMTAGSQIGLYVERKWAPTSSTASSRSRWICSASRRFDGYFLRVNPAWAARARLHEDGARGIAVPRLRAPRRSGRHVDARVGADDRQRRSINFENRYRAQRRFLSMAGVDRRAVRRCRASIYAAARDVTDRKRGRGSAAGVAAAHLQQLVDELDVAGSGRSGDRRQGRVPGQHEPRDPHADERDHRHDRSGAAHAAHAAAARVPPDRATSRPRRC